MSDTVLTASEHRKAVGARLRRVIDLLGMTSKDVGELMGVTKQSMTDYLGGKSYPNGYGVYRLYKLKGITYDFLFLGDWSGLPPKLAQALDAELRAEMDAALARDQAGAETNS
jgi:transcriptional regulator with XRE-family HTH domain